MALGLGEGAELRAPLAVTVISGLLLATILTLVVVPVVYTLLSGASRRELGTEGISDVQPVTPGTLAGASSGKDA